MGLVLHQHRSEVIDLARQALAWCEQCDIVGSLPPTDAELVGRPDLAVAEAEFGPGLDLCLSLGGDGTMLRTTHLVVRHGVPILGVNAGHLGYLTSVDPSDLGGALDAWKAGSLEIEERMLLEIEVSSSSADVSKALALNEVVVERAEVGHSVSVAAAIGGKHFTRYLADGLIVATPTGSTAYSLSAGGPIVEPNFDALVMTPVAAHMVFNRSMILAPSTEVELTIDGYRAGAVSVDGRRLATVEPGDSVVCGAAKERARFVVRGDRDFHTVLKDKFGLEDR